ncbi:hypothetical protein ABZ749_13070, partial [Micromonospora sp. NPDC047753]
MRPSSSPSDGLLGGLSGAPDVDAELSDPSVLQAMLDVEAALVRAAADAGILPPPAATAIVEQCRAERYDPGALGRAADATGNPVVPLVGELTAAVPEDARAWVHFGGPGCWPRSPATRGWRRRAVPATSTRPWP